MVGVEVLPEKALFILGFLVVLGITLAKIYNVMHKGEKYGFDVAIMLFVGFAFAYGTSLFIYLNYAAELSLLTLFRFETFFMVVNVALLIAEILLNLSRVSQEATRDRYTPIKV